MEEATAQLQPADDAAAVRRRILIVDDDPNEVEALALRLEKQGFIAMRAATGGEALREVKSRRPHLVLLDLQLPDLDGLSVGRQIFDDPQTFDIPVIVVSGMVRPDIVRCSRAAGCRYYVRKPYDPNALLVLIEQAIGESMGW